MFLLKITSNSCTVRPVENLKPGIFWVTSHIQTPKVPVDEEHMVTKQFPSNYEMDLLVY
jgi:hypothetical protein